MSWDQDQVLELLNSVGAVKTNGHFVDRPGSRHDSTRVAKRELLRRPHITEKLASIMADYLRGQLRQVDIIVSPPAVVAAVLGQRVAYLLGKDFVYPKRLPDSDLLRLNKGAFQAGSRVLIVQDIISERSHRRTKLAIEAAQKTQGIVLGVATLCNCDGVTAGQLGVLRIYSLCGVEMKSWSEEECRATGPCSRRVPISLEGKKK